MVFSLWRFCNLRWKTTQQTYEYFTTAKQPARNQAGRRISSALTLRSTRTLPHGKEVHTMPHLWPKDTDFALWELDVLDRDCPACGRMMHICDHRYRHFFTLDGPVELVCKLNHCPDPRCPGHARTRSPEVEPAIALPGWGIAWDVFCWVGHR